MPEHMKKLIIEALKKHNLALKEARIAILGLAFLENSDDTRDTPAEPLYRSLQKTCKDIIIHDPYINEYEDFNVTKNLNEALKGSDCIAIVTRHKDYLELKPDKMKKLLRYPIIVDGRNTLDQEKYIKAGFTFLGVGLPHKL